MLNLPFPRRDDVLVGKSAAAPKPCFSLVEMRTPKAASSLLPAGTASTIKRSVFHQSPLWFCPTEDINFRTSIQYAMYSSFWKMKVLETKSRQTLVFDPGDSIDRLRACPFLKRWSALLHVKVFLWAPDYTRRWSVFLVQGRPENNIPREV